MIPSQRASLRSPLASPVLGVIEFCRPAIIRNLLILISSLGLVWALAASPPARAGYFSKEKFATYHSDGPYPFWNKTWLPLDPRVHFDVQGIPVVEYGAEASYNPVTIAAFGLLAYNRLAEDGKAKDRVFFLRMADWLVAHQEPQSGCWYYDFDFSYPTLDDTIAKPWTSAMAQGLAISALTRAYLLTDNTGYLRAAERALLSFHKNVDEGGVRRNFSFPVGSALHAGTPFYEEYPTKRAASFTLNGFMFALVGLYDLARLKNQDAQELFDESIVTLREALPLYDLGNGSSYDLGHLTRPPRKIHQDDGYHLIHITLLNALGTATLDPTLLWYRDHWNSYGSSLGTELIWLRRAAYWMARRQQPALGAATLLLVAMLGLLARIFLRRKKERGSQTSGEPFRGAYFLRAHRPGQPTLQAVVRTQPKGNSSWYK